MILEGMVTTLDEAGRLNVAPMGPVVTPDLSRFLFRPYQTSRTYHNLKIRPQGVFHVVDDVELIARAALDGLVDPPATFPATRIVGQILSDACRWFEFEVTRLDDREPRTEIDVRIVHEGRLRDHFGFNRAKHAVLEATILATRLHLLEESFVREELARWRTPYEKTAGPAEHRAWAFVVETIERWYAARGTRTD
mgnify:CR=1 FL=1